MIHENEYLVDDDPILWAALKRAGMEFCPINGWYRPEDVIPADVAERVQQRTLEAVADDFDEVAASWPLVVEVGD